jgi:aminomethyltransferase
MKTTPFTSIHQALGAKMAEFAGYNMPIEYAGILPEHQAVCESVGVFDVSHMGEFWVSGPHALAFLQNLVSNDVRTVAISQAQYSCLPNENGGIVDDLIVYRIAEEEYLVVVNASNIDKDWSWFVAHNTVGADLENMSDQTAQLAIQGPKAIDVLQKLTDIDLASIPYYHFAVGTLDGVEDVLISNTGYTGAGGFEIYFAPEMGKQLWDAIFQAGAEFGILPIGLGARDTLRLEMCF